ncbi:HNH endonuclease signature motif containing protein [Kitasatospora sp. NPDC087861]|uniref:HNH endonuclease signature motif containing protein n=1 Tax=Kitasatospora sp. NPDC087861 TaxID=3364070 RepID=UPI003808ACFA
MKSWLSGWRLWTPAVVRHLHQVRHQPSVKGTATRPGTSHIATALDVDHIAPIAPGGADVAGNVQLLCHDRHAAKTRGEFRARRPAF